MQQAAKQLPLWREFGAPAHWPTWLGLATLYALHKLPYSWQLWLGRGIGRLLPHLGRRRAKIARINIDLCFPELSETEREALLHEHFKAMGMGLFESAMGWWGSRERLTPLGEIHGIEHLQEATRNKQGAILLTGHFSTMEIAGGLVGLAHPVCSMYRPMKNPLMDRVVLRARQSKLLKIFPRSEVTSLVRGLRQGDIIWYGYDQNYGLKHALFTPFFGVEAATITTTSRLARSGRAAVIPFFPVRTSDGRYRINIHPPLKGFPSGDDAEDNRRLNQLLEEAIRQAPEQYFWIHRRFKTRPPGEARIY